MGTNNICFTVDNFEEIAKADSERLEKLDERLVQIGAFPVKEDYIEKVLCLDITECKLSNDEIMEIIKKFGYEIKVKK